MPQSDQRVQQAVWQHRQPGAGQTQRSQPRQGGDGQLRVPVQYRQRVVGQTQIREAREVGEHVLEDGVNLRRDGANGCIGQVVVRQKWSPAPKESA